VKHNTTRRVILAYVDTGITALETAARLAHAVKLTECAMELFEHATKLRELSGKIAVAIGIGLKRRG
jgi:hypothetical protein